MSNPSTTPARTKKRNLAIGSGVVAAALLFGWFSYSATKPEATASGPSSSDAVAEVSPAPQDDTYAQLAKLARRDAKDPLAQGRADAPVVLIEYADFRCGFCGKFARDTEPDLVKKYVDAGKLRIEWRNFPIFGEESEAAARGAWAAGQQGKFWEFHAAAYEEGAKEKGFGDDRLKALARQAGVADVDCFVRDVASEDARKAVSRDQEEAYGLGATSTPSFLINGRPIAGAQPAETFTQAIDAALATAAGGAK
ncbi:thioredoxin domain-containing protein [Streptomyces sp. TRM66268-LWL]|uniref:Thioredoxin domain-containing protein n=1 Tax=Streptomyces polyasparticus TaxID=2767826 RepID=A0ABR7SUB6_9ACTN|nr:thioredoxin domain-containing protein [Streptomyces polyasparticus]MBC9719091.1 thioredoxin domain-containing protein [Streptomyces polyasparticus]